MKNWAIVGIAAMSMVAACSAIDKSVFTNYEETSRVSRISDSTKIPDAMAGINREKNRLDFLFYSEGTPTGIYSVWLCGFNDPSQCADTPCRTQDLMAGIGDGFCQWGGAAIADDESGSFAIRGRSDVTPEVILGNGLTNISGAEIHLILRSHGFGLKGDKLWAALTSFDGGCPPNLCVDEQIAVFPAP